MSVFLLALPLALAEDPTYRGLCRPDEVVVFSCPVNNNKQLSVCRTSAGVGLQYRFGPMGAPELETPAAANVNDLTLWSFEEKMYARSMAEELTVKNGEFTYTVIAQQGGMDSFLGVVVRKGGQDLATVPCVGETVRMNFAQLPAPLKQ